LRYFERNKDKLYEIADFVKENNYEWNLRFLDNLGWFDGDLWECFPAWQCSDDFNYEKIYASTQSVVTGFSFHKKSGSSYINNFVTVWMRWKWEIWDNFFWDWLNPVLAYREWFFKWKKVWWDADLNDYRAGTSHIFNDDWWIIYHCGGCW
jgi:hypothetical protein